jgi:GAF domain-containing protein
MRYYGKGGGAMAEDTREPEVLRRLDEVTGHLADLAGVLANEEGLGQVLQRSVDHREVVRTGVTGAERRWPQFARSARGAGVESYLSCPLIIGEEFAGSLNLYSEQPHGFADFDVALLRLYVTAACAAIDNARRYARARQLADQLNQALNSRAIIDQAIGVLIAQTGITADRAFAELSRRSQNSNVKLREVAAQLIASQQAG